MRTRRRGGGPTKEDCELENGTWDDGTCFLEAHNSEEGILDEHRKEHVKNMQIAHYQKLMAANQKLDDAEEHNKLMNAYRKASADEIKQSAAMGGKRKKSRKRRRTRRKNLARK